MSMTLIDMTQNILSAIESDEVNSIGDTQEALQVATFIKETYFYMVAGKDWPFLRTNTNLVGLSDTTRPAYMEFPSACDKVFWIKYNKKDVTWMEPKQFQDMLDTRIATTGVVDANGFILNSDPLWWTTFDDSLVIFDGYDSSIDSTLQSAKSQVYIQRVPSWSQEDSFIPELPEKMFPMLLADAKGTCFLNMKQTSNAKEEQKAKELRIRMSKESVRANDAEDKYNTAVNFGRGTPSLTTRLKVR